MAIVYEDCGAEFRGELQVGRVGAWLDVLHSDSERIWFQTAEGEVFWRVVKRPNPEFNPTKCKWYKGNHIPANAQWIGAYDIPKSTQLQY